MFLTMREFASEAVVLGFSPLGEMDARFFLFTERLGKISARAKSVRKITSKLAGHLRPGSIVKVRLVEKNGMQVVDALKIGSLAAEEGEMEMLEKILHEGEREPRLWSELSSGRFNWNEALKILGWDPDEAACSLCAAKPDNFSVATQEFFCKNCTTARGNYELIYI